MYQGDMHLTMSTLCIKQVQVIPKIAPFPVFCDTGKYCGHHTRIAHRNSTRYSQSCPDEDRMGFVFSDEFSAEWPHLQQTRVLVFHSWIAEYANVGNITGLSESLIPSFYSILA